MRLLFNGMPFIVTKFDGLDGKTKVSYQHEKSDFKVIADQTGIELQSNFKITDMNELQGFAELISNMWKEHVKLAPKIIKTTNASGH